MPGTKIEYAVYDRTAKRLAGLGFDAIKDSEQKALDFIAFLERTREELREKADANEASGFEGGNEDWWRFNKEGWVDADWIVVRREVTDWQELAPAAHA